MSTVSFQVGQQDLAVQFEREIERRMQRAVGTAFVHMVENANVRTGAYRASFRVALDGVDSSFESGTPLSGEVIPRPAFPASVINGWRIGRKIFISNNIAHAGFQEFGTDTQEPNFTVRNGALAGAASLAGELRGDFDA